MRQVLQNKLSSTNQGEIISRWEKLSLPEQNLIEKQLESVDLELVASLYQKRNQTISLPDIRKIETVPVLNPSSTISKQRWKA